VKTLASDVLVVGMGGNIGSEAQIRERFVHAREAFASFGELRSASLYRTAPIGPAQPSFLNTAIRVRAEHATADELIATVLEIERLLGRARHSEARWGPRLIDLDILVWGMRKLSTPELEVPHPRVVERRFALQPLIDVVGGDLVLPGQRDSLDRLERRVAGQGLELVATTW
jgi:2-amino-4-hydroxy-6-hydroxymethyldihydropteridine diphosphokinase